MILGIHSTVDNCFQLPPSFCHLRRPTTGRSARGRRDAVVSARTRRQRRTVAQGKKLTCSYRRKDSSCSLYVGDVDLRRWRCERLPRLLLPRPADVGRRPRPQGVSGRIHRGGGGGHDPGGVSQGCLRDFGRRRRHRCRHRHRRTAECGGCHRAVLQRVSRRGEIGF